MRSLFCIISNTTNWCKSAWIVDLYRSKLHFVALVAALQLSTAALPAPVPIAFIAPDEEPRYANLLLGLRQGLTASGLGSSDIDILEHRIRRGDADAARRAGVSVSARQARVAFVVGTDLTRAVRSAAAQLPIVFITPGDPVRARIAANLARPGNNLTGMTFEYPELSAKRIELLKELVPKARRVGILYDHRDASPQQSWASCVEAAAAIGVTLVEMRVEGFGSQRDLAATKLDGLVLVPGGAILTVAQAAIARAAAGRIATVVWGRTDATRDAIVSYGVEDSTVARNAARLVVQIVKGQPAGNIPIERPTTLELHVNIKAAKAAGIAVPRSILLRADRIPE
jgi:putative ABC transport system substrate-binding protein